MFRRSQEKLTIEFLLGYDAQSCICGESPYGGREFGLRKPYKNMVVSRLDNF